MFEQRARDASRDGLPDTPTVRRRSTASASPDGPARWSQRGSVSLPLCVTSPVQRARRHQDHALGEEPTPTPSSLPPLSSVRSLSLSRSPLSVSLSLNSARRPDRHLLAGSQPDGPPGSLLRQNGSTRRRRVAPRQSATNLANVHVVSSPSRCTVAARRVVVVVLAVVSE